MTSLQVNSAKQTTPLTKSIKQIVSNRDRFFKAICDGPSHACYACQKFCYKENAQFYACDEAKKLIVHQNVNSQLVTSEWFCRRCISALNRNKVPSTSQWNGMSVSPIPHELQGLNSLEERLIARVAPFMKLVLLPRGGQRGITGQVINFPSPMTEVLNQLPRPATSSDIVYIKAPTSNSLKESKPLYYHCRYTRVMKALKWLQENNVAYKNISITNQCEENFDSTDACGTCPKSHYCVNGLEFGRV